jgi:hypothetical protein
MTTGGLATADGLQTADSQYILTGPQSILATEEPAMLVTVLAVRRRRSRGGARGAARRSYSARGAHGVASLLASRQTGGHSGQTEPLSQPRDGPADTADGRRRRSDEEELAMKRKEGSQRAFHADFNVLETPLTRVVGMKFFPSLSCFPSTHMPRYLMCMKQLVKFH